LKTLELLTALDYKLAIPFTGIQAINAIAQCSGAMLNEKCFSETSSAIIDTPVIDYFCQSIKFFSTNRAIRIHLKPPLLMKRIMPINFLILIRFFDKSLAFGDCLVDGPVKACLKSTGAD
jgi:hypothetical protein